MAGAAMNKLLDELSQQVKNLAVLISKADDRVATLQNELRMFKARLRDNYGNTDQRNHATSEEVNRRIITIIYRIHDAIDDFTHRTPDIKHKNPLVRCIKRFMLLDVAKKFEIISKDIESVKLLPLPPADLVPRPGNKPPHRDEMEGFKKELEKTINYVKEENEKLDVIPIIGMPGVGKTMLAHNVYNHPEIKSEFGSPNGCRIWIDVRSKYEKKEVLLSILSHLTDVTDNTKLKSDYDISQMIRDRLWKSNKFLVVMDGVLSANAWRDFERAFPTGCKKGKKKILITTQLEEVAGCGNIDGGPVRLSLLTSDESWKLLESEAFGNNSEHQSELKSFGRLIALKCGGLPLLLVTAGNILKNICSESATTDPRETLEYVCKSLSSYLDKHNFFEHMNTSFYYSLRPHLRPCLLYIGVFPEGFDIPVRTLTQLWIAEGFVCELAGVPLEQTAQEYLQELIDRNLVMVGKRGPNGRVKTCRVHYMLREFCRKEASIDKENIFQEMVCTENNTFEHSNVDQCRRLCIGSNVKDFFTSCPPYPLIHSFFYFPQESNSQPLHIPSIPQGLKLLRVLEAKHITFTKLSADWSKLALLRYVVLSIDFEVIPKVISKLRNMQTLVIVLTKGSRVEIKANIWKMSQLKHVKTNVSTKLPSVKKGKEGNMLQTLGMISHESCTKDVFDRVRSLKKLGIRGQLDTLLQAKGLDSLHKLEKLKLDNDLNFGVLQQLPKADEFPPCLTSLTLCSTKLDWSQMFKLAVLNNLKVLKLKQRAFDGELWRASSGGFLGLQVLHIDNNELKVWEAPNNPFPKLRCLVLSNCTKLEKIPLSLRESLQNLDLEKVKNSVLTSAKKIKMAKNDLSLKAQNIIDEA